MNLKSELSIIKKNWEVKLIEIVGIITEDGGGCVSHTGTHLNSYRKLQPILNLCLLTTNHRQKPSNTIFYNLLQIRTEPECHLVQIHTYPPNLPNTY
jgi:hypothetical protein